MPRTFHNYSGIINVKDYGAVGNGASDDTAAIQAAIDAAFAANTQCVYLPPGGYNTSGPLYLDPPGNLRSNFANPSNFNFSMALVGEPGGANHEGFGSRIFPQFNNAAALYVGPGQGMVVRSVQIVGNDFAYRKAKNPASIGIGICGSNGGASRTLIENCWVERFYNCIMTSANGNGIIGDSNTLRKCVVQDGYRGVFFASLENFINHLDDCVINYCTIAVDASLGTPCTVTCGNIASLASASAAFTWSSVSAITNVGGQFRFTATLSSDDTNMVAGVYDCFTIVTAHYGVVPLDLVSYNSGTKVGTFKLHPSWVNYFYGFESNPLTASDLSTEVQATTKVYCAELTRSFIGDRFNITGIHYEQDGAPADRLIQCDSGFGDGGTSTITNLYGDNSDPSVSIYGPNAGGSPSDANLAKYYTMQQFGWIAIGTGGLEIRNSQLGIGVFGSATVPPDVVTLEYMNDGSLTQRVMMNGNIRAAFNFRAVAHLSFTNFYNIVSSGGLGAGEFDRSPWGNLLGVNDGNPGNGGYSFIGTWGVSPFWGFRPAPWSRPMITPAMQTTIAGALPAITHTGTGLNTIYTITYPELWGGQIYGLGDYTLGSQTHYHTVSTHAYYTLGQNLTTSNVPNLAWSYKGGSPVLYVNPEVIPLLHNGLGIVLDNGGGPQTYIISGVHPGLRYVTVYGQLAGTAGTVYTGTVIGQQPFVLQYP